MQYREYKDYKDEEDPEKKGVTVGRCGQLVDDEVTIDPLKVVGKGGSRWIWDMRVGCRC
jgi:hypothetical protein